MATTGISPKRKAPAPSAGPEGHGVTLSPSLCHTRLCHTRNLPFPQKRKKAPQCGAFLR